MYKKKQFPNKLRLITVPSTDTKAITILFLFGVGSRYETKEINGASHFIEHLMFKGTKKRPTTLDISRELDSVGAEFNAMTSKDYTGYYIKINHEKAELAVDVLSDMLLNSNFAPKEIDKERGVIVEEINMYLDNPIMYIENLLEAIMYPHNPLGWDIAGPVETIKTITPKQLVDFKSKFYRTDNVVVSIAGKITPKIEKLLQEKFINKLQDNGTKLEVYKKFKSKQTKARISIQHRKTKQVQLALGFPAFGYDDERIYALHLLTVILGGNMSSRLFIQIREKQGLAYFIRCYPNYYQDSGNLYIQSGLDVTRVDEAFGLIQKELRKIKKNGVSQKELNNAREFLRGKVVLALEDSSHLAEFYSKQLLLQNKIMTPEEKMKKYDEVKITDIKKLATELFVPEKLNLAVIGPFKDDKKFYKQINL